MFELCSHQVIDLGLMASVEGLGFEVSVLGVGRWNKLDAKPLWQHLYSVSKPGKMTASCQLRELIIASEITQHPALGFEMATLA